MATLFNSTDAATLQREVIMPGVRQYQNAATPLLKYFEREIQPSPTGEFLIVFNKTRNNNAGSGRAEEGVDLPEAVAAAAGRATVPSKQQYTRAKWTGKIVAATKTKDSLVDAIVYQTESASREHKHSKNRQLNGDGKDALGYYVSGAGGMTTVVTDQFGSVGGDFFQTGVTTVDLINGGTHAVRQAGLVATRSSLVATGRQVTTTVNLDAGATAGDYFVLAGVQAAGVSQQLMGIRGTISAANPPLLSGGLQGVTVASVPEFAASIVIASSGNTENDAATTWGDLQYHLLQRVLTEIDRNSDEGSEGIAFILTSPPGFDTYLKLAKDERITVNEMTLDGGFKGLSFNSLIMVKDKHTRLGAYYFINPGSHKLYALDELDWDESDGSMFYRLNGGDRDALGATLKEYIELGVHTRNVNGALLGVNMLYV